jgi:hypothetical protein
MGIRTRSYIFAYKRKSKLEGHHLLVLEQSLNCDIHADLDKNEVGHIIE